MLSGGKYEKPLSPLEAFIKAMSEDKQNAPPIRVITVGDDMDFNQFIQQYVELLDIYIPEDDEIDIDQYESNVSRSSKNVTIPNIAVKE